MSTFNTSKSENIPLQPETTTGVVTMGGWQLSEVAQGKKYENSEQMFAREIIDLKYSKEELKKDFSILKTEKDTYEKELHRVHGWVIGIAVGSAIAFLIGFITITVSALQNNSLYLKYMDLSQNYSSSIQNQE